MHLTSEAQLTAGGIRNVDAKRHYRVGIHMTSLGERMYQIRRGTSLLFVGSLAISASACADPASQAPSPAVSASAAGISTSTSDAGTKVFVWDGPPSNAEYQALLEGTLALDDQNCLTVKMPNGNQSVVILPAGSTATAEGAKLPDSNVLNVGEAVSFGGGHTEFLDVQKQCAANIEPFIIQDTGK